MENSGLNYEDAVNGAARNYEGMLATYENDLSHVQADIEKKTQELNALKLRKKMLTEDKERILGALGVLKEITESAKKAGEADNGGQQLIEKTLHINDSNIQNFMGKKPEGLDEAQVEQE